MCVLSATYHAIKYPLFEVTLGIVIGVPFVIALKKLTLGKFDELAGNLSYGVYLNHFFIIWCFQVAGLPRSSNLYAPSLLAISLLLAWASYELVEKRVVTARRRLRESAHSISERTVSVNFPAQSSSSGF